MLWHAKDEKNVKYLQKSCKKRKIVKNEIRK